MSNRALKKMPIRYSSRRELDPASTRKMKQYGGRGRIPQKKNQLPISSSFWRWCHLGSHGAMGGSCIARTKAREPSVNMTPETRMRNQVAR
jgi:hypothetical protein